VGSLVSCREFGGVLRVVLVFGDALLASAVAGFTAIHAESAGIVFFCAGDDVRAGHETVGHETVKIILRGGGSLTLP